MPCQECTWYTQIGVFVVFYTDGQEPFASLQGTHVAASLNEQPKTVAEVPAAVKVEPAEAITTDVQTNGMSTTSGFAVSAAVKAEPSEASMTVDAGEGPAAKRAKHTGMAESEAANAPVTFPAPTSTPAPPAAEPSDAQGGSLWTPSHLPNTFSLLSHTLMLCMLG